MAHAGDGEAFGHGGVLGHGGERVAGWRVRHIESPPIKVAAPAGRKRHDAPIVARCELPPSPTPGPSAFPADHVRSTFLADHVRATPKPGYRREGHRHLCSRSICDIKPMRATSWLNAIYYAFDFRHSITRNQGARR